MFQRLKETRKTLGYTQKEFAAYLGITQTAYSMIENGIRPLSTKYVRVICITFSVSESFLLTGEGEMFLSLPREEELITVFGRLLPKTQNYLLLVAKELLDMQHKLLNPKSEN